MTPADLTPSAVFFDSPGFSSTSFFFPHSARMEKLAVLTIHLLLVDLAVTVHVHFEGLVVERDDER